MLGVVDELVHGRMPSLPDVLLVRTALIQRWDLHKPLNLADTIRNAAADVSRREGCAVLAGEGVA